MVRLTTLLICLISTSDQELSIGVALTGLLLAGVPPETPPGAVTTACLNTLVRYSTLARFTHPVVGNMPPAPVYSSKSFSTKPPAPSGGPWIQYQTPSLAHGPPEKLAVVASHQLVSRPLWLMPKSGPSMVKPPVPITMFMLKRTA